MRSLLSLCPDSGDPALRVISHSGCAAENTPLRQIVLCLSELNGCRRFSDCPDSSGPALRVISHSGCAAENTPLRQIVLCLSELNGHCRFSILLQAWSAQTHPYQADPHTRRQ